MTTKKHFDELIESLSNLNDSAQLRQFLTAILTKDELATIATRLQIVKLLKSGMTQRRVSQKLKVGIATVTKGSKELQKGHFDLI